MFNPWKRQGINAMEKKTPHTPLSKIKALVQAGKVSVTATALLGGRTVLGADMKTQDLYAVVLTLTSKDFFKCMTAYEDHTVWHEVYRPFHSSGVQLYIKLIVRDGVLVVSFKEK